MKTPKPETMKLSRQFRVAQIRAAEGSDEYELTFSDETPVDRFFGKEVLLHGPSNVRLKRLNSGAPLLFNHNANEPIGVVVPGSATIGQDRRGRARVRFLPTTKGREAKQMVDGGLRNTSCGYDIHAVRELAKGDGFEAIDWEPSEVSLAPVPAVTSVGFMRAAPGTEHEVTVTRHSDSAPAVRDASREPAASAATTKGVAMSDVSTAAAAGNAEGTPSVQMGNDGAAQERLRITAIDQLCKRNYNGYRPSDDDRAKWIQEGKSPDEVANHVLEQISQRAKATGNETAIGSLGMSPKEIQQFSITRAVRACTEKSWPKVAPFEAEISQALGRKIGKQAGEYNFYVPLEVQQARGMAGQRDMLVATSTLGGYLVGTQVSGFIDLLRNRSVVMRLGATMMPGLSGSVSVPKLTGAATGYWFANEAGTATESTPTIGQMTLIPKTVGGYVEVSRQLMLQTNYNADAIINADLARVIGLAVDTAAIAGPGTAGQPTGILSATGVGTANAATGTAVVYADMIRFQSTVAAANAMLPGFAYVTTPTIAGIYMAKARFTNSDTPVWEGNILDGRVVGSPAMTSLQIGSGTVLGGDFSQVVIGEWGVLEIEANPYAQFQSGIVGIRALYTCDVGVRYGAAFAVGTNFSS